MDFFKGLNVFLILLPQNQEKLVFSLLFLKKMCLPFLSKGDSGHEIGTRQKNLENAEFWGFEVWRPEFHVHFSP